MPSKRCWEVGGVPYTAAATLRKAWSARVARYSGSGRRIVGPADAAWFVEAAMVTGAHGRLLHLAAEATDAEATSGQRDDDDDGVAPTTTLRRLVAGTDVWVDCASSAFGRAGDLPARRAPAAVPRHLRGRRCVFFARRGVPSTARAAAVGRLGARPSSSSGHREVAQGAEGRTPEQWMRRAVQNQIDTFRRRRRVASTELAGAARRPYACAHCGRCCLRRENHVDHGTGENSFRALVRRFGESELGRPAVAEDTRDPAIVRAWQRFHLKRAQLLLACRACNLANK